MIDFSKKSIINGDKVSLRPFQKNDLALLEEILTDEEVIRVTGSEDDFDKKIVRIGFGN